MMTRRQKAGIEPTVKIKTKFRKKRETKIHSEVESSHSETISSTPLAVRKELQVHGLLDLSTEEGVCVVEKPNISILSTTEEEASAFARPNISILSTTEEEVSVVDKPNISIFSTTESEDCEELSEAIKDLSLESEHEIKTGKKIDFKKFVLHNEYTLIKTFEKSLELQSFLIELSDYMRSSHSQFENCSII